MTGTIRIKLGGVEVSVDGDVERDRLEDVLSTLKRQLPELMAAEPAERRVPPARELLDRADARTFGEKAGVIAFWLEEHCGRADWRSADIIDALRDAGESTPANITDALNQKLKKGLFEVRDRRWKLTGEGRGWVRYQLLAEREDG